MMCPSCKIGLLRINEEPLASCIACCANFNITLTLINRPMPIVVRDCCKMVDVKGQIQREIIEKKGKKPPVFSFS